MDGKQQPKISASLRVVQFCVTSHGAWYGVGSLVGSLLNYWALHLSSLSLTVVSGHGCVLSLSIGGKLNMPGN